MNIQYIAGFFDADGSITMSLNKKGDKFKTIKIDFANVEKSILLDIQEHLSKFGITTNLSTKLPRKQTHSTSYALSCTTNQKCILLCKLLESKHPKKLHRINTILKYHNEVTIRNGKYTDKQYARKKAYERLFFSTYFHK